MLCVLCREGYGLWWCAAVGRVVPDVQFSPPLPEPVPAGRMGDANQGVVLTRTYLTGRTMSPVGRPAVLKRLPPLPLSRRV